MRKIEKLNVEIKAVKLWLKTFENESLEKDYMIKKLSKLYNEIDKLILKSEYNKLIKQMYKYTNSEIRTKAEEIKIKLSNLN
jgi:hypothetical protein